MPVALTARTRTLCAPSPPLPSSSGELQALKLAPSMLHCALEVGSSDVKATCTVPGATRPLGACVIVIWGPVGAAGAGASVFQLAVAGVASTLPAASIARTANVWGPVRGARTSGEAQPAKAAPSTLHWNEPAASLEMKLKVTESGHRVAARPAHDRRVGRGRVDRPVSRRRCRIDGPADGAHGEVVCAVPEPAVGRGARACGEGAAVELALERAARLARREGERRAAIGHEPGRARRQEGVGRRDVARQRDLLDGPQPHRADLRAVVVLVRLVQRQLRVGAREDSDDERRRARMRGRLEPERDRVRAARAQRGHQHRFRGGGGFRLRRATRSRCACRGRHRVRCSSR